MIFWFFICYVEMVLIYVEVSIEIGDEVIVREWINRICFWFGMFVINDSGDMLMDWFCNECCIELVYEEYCYYDVCCWMIVFIMLGRGIKVINVRVDFKVGVSLYVLYWYDKFVYDYSYIVVDNIENENRFWDDKMYYWFISCDEINRND